MPEPATESTRLSNSVIVIYSLPAIAFGFAGSLVSLYFLKFATDALLLAPGVVAFAFSLSRFWDALSDPIVGYLSDRTRHRWGRRRPWIALGALPFALTFVALWAPPSGVQGGALAWWVGGAVILFYTLSTVVAVPHLALGAELTQDYHDRSRLFGGRGFIEFSGLLLAGGGMWMLETADDERAVARWLVVAFAFACVALLWSSTRVLTERFAHRERRIASPARAVGDILANSHARLLLVVFFIETLGFGFLTTLFPYMTQYVLGDDLPAAAYLLTCVAVALLTFPMWVPLSRRFGKRNPWIAAFCVKAACFAGMYFANADNTWIVMPIVVALGAVQGAGMILGPSIKSDIIDVDEARTGERKEGSYFAGWSFASKTASGTAILLSGLALQATGYAAGSTTQNETSLEALRFLFATVPFCLHVVAIALLLRFRLDEKEHAQVRATLAARD